MNILNNSRRIKNTVLIYMTDPFLHVLTVHIFYLCFGKIHCRCKNTIVIYVK